MRNNVVVVIFMAITLASTIVKAENLDDFTGDKTTQGQEEASHRDENIVPMIRGGLALGGVSFSAGLFLSAELMDTNIFTDDIKDPFYIGSALGAMGLSAGVHLGNGNQGSWPLSTLTSVALGAAGAYWIAENPDDNGLALVIVPLVQLSAVMAVERGTTPKGPQPKVSPARSSAQVGFLPVKNGGGLVVSGSF